MFCFIPFHFISFQFLTCLLFYFYFNNKYRNSIINTTNDSIQAIPSTTINNENNFVDLGILALEEYIHNPKTTTTMKKEKEQNAKLKFNQKIKRIENIKKFKPSAKTTTTAEVIFSVAFF